MYVYIHAASTIELGISTYRTQSNCRTLGISVEYIGIIDSLEFNFILKKMKMHSQAAFTETTLGQVPGNPRSFWVFNFKYTYNTYTTFKFQDTNKNINVTTGTPYSLHDMYINL